MNNIINAILKSKEHANLDSFSFRYGYYFLEDTNLNFFNVTEFKDMESRDLVKIFWVRECF